MKNSLTLSEFMNESFETLANGKRPDSVKHYVFSKSGNKKFLVTAPHGSSFSNDIKAMAKHIENIDLKDSKSYRKYDPDSEVVANLLGKMLDCEVLTLSNATNDHNKIVDDFYIKYVNKLKPQYLIEIHTHQMKHVDRDTVEISSGRSNNSLSIKFATALEKSFHSNGMLNISVLGDYNKIFYKASKTASVNGDGYGGSKGNTLHIELPQSICNSSNTSKLAKILYDAIKNCL